MTTHLGKAIFLDRDGVLNAMVYDEDHGLLDSPRRPADVRMIPGAGTFLASIRRAGWLAVVVSNQPGIAKEYFTVSELEAVNQALLEQCRAEGGPEALWDDLLYCPYHPTGREGRSNPYVTQSPLRKPEPGMLLEAAKRHHLNLAASWMVGDGLVDVQAGRRAGCRTLLVAGSLKLEVIERFLSMKDAYPDRVAGDLTEALHIIKASPA
ncbi:MAG TPA: HAD family hydrolase [Kiritimatiellia bacterium]|nr:HAD family hydrolase [Kiritimatiellia bacterium]HMO98299.1 HAD family hydrolase [Kiritimatiellia bacterium]HMP95505.1 HAD family hydrolase [Kiritimatiellia bacterium]